MEGYYQNVLDAVAEVSIYKQALVVFFGVVLIGAFIQFSFLWLWSAKDYRFHPQRLGTPKKSLIYNVIMVGLLAAVLVVTKLIFREVPWIAGWYAFFLLLAWIIMIYLTLDLIGAEFASQRDEEIRTREFIL